MKQKTKTRFTFHRIGWINQNNEIISGWWGSIETEEQLDAYLLYIARDIAQIWLDIKDSPDYKEGHCRTTRADVYKYLLNMKIEREGRKQIPMPEAVNYIEQEATKTTINIFVEEGSVYVNSKGGCRTVHLRDDHSGVDEEIFETCVNKDFVFPTLGEDAIKITNWPLCPHFYLFVNGKNVEVDGVQKWKTIQGAEEAKAKYLRRNRYRGVRE